LQQNQVWQQGDQYVRIVVLERLRVEYKVMKDLAAREGTHHQATKKEFCRMLKGAVLVPPSPPGVLSGGGKGTPGTGVDGGRTGGGKPRRRGG
jgi:hypothetical protein